MIGFRKFMVRQGVSFRIINSVWIKRIAFRIPAADLTIHAFFRNYTPAEQTTSEMFSHLNNLLVVFMARYRCKGCMSIIGVDEKAAFYIRLYRVIEYPATIKRSMWQGKTTDRMDCLLSQQGYAFRSEFFFKGHQSVPYSFRRPSSLPQKNQFYPCCGIGIPAYPFHTADSLS